MRSLFSAPVFLLLLATSGCQTARQTWICGTAMFENMMADQAAQSSPFVLCQKESESDLILKITAEVPQLAEKTETVFFFRTKKIGETVSPRHRRLPLERRDSPSPIPPGEADLTIQGTELWLWFSLSWGKRNPDMTGSNTFGFRAAYLQDFSRTEGGMRVVGAWKRKSAGA